MLTNVSMADLNSMDLSQHCYLMEDWNEDTGFEWGPATVYPMGSQTVVVQEDGQGGLHIATYDFFPEGKLTSMRVYNPRIDPYGNTVRLGRQLSMQRNTQ